MYFFRNSTKNKKNINNISFIFIWFDLVYFTFLYRIYIYLIEIIISQNILLLGEEK